MSETFSIAETNLMSQLMDLNNVLAFYPTKKKKKEVFQFFLAGQQLGNTQGTFAQSEPSIWFTYTMAIKNFGYL